MPAVNDGPLERLLDRVRPAASGSAPDAPIVVGGGAAGVEIAFALGAGASHRGSASVSDRRITLVHDGDAVPAGAYSAMQVRVQRQAHDAGVGLVLGRRVVEVDGTGVVLDNAVRIEGAPVIWATGAVGAPLLRDSDLPLAPGGFVRTRPTLQVIGHDRVLAAGDCAVPADRPDLPRAGVHAVRQGPVLARNLVSLLDGDACTTYRPQRDFLRLLNLGDGTAVGGKWGVAVRGRCVMWLKDRIDRRFIRRFS